ncbi:MAG: hypothetical protein AB1646_14445 [Thermodesulfobacteriota bacterium]
MFLHDLTENQKAAFLLLSKRLIREDERLAPEESTLLGLMRREMGFDGDPTYEKKDVGDLLIEFDSRKAKVATLLELMGLACSVGEYRRDQAPLIDEVASTFGIPEEELVTMENWILRQMALAREAAGFFME